jgi:hypothetical protein
MSFIDSWYLPDDDTAPSNIKVNLTHSLCRLSTSQDIVVIRQVPGCRDSRKLIKITAETCEYMCVA